MGLGLLPGTELDDDMEPRMNRPKFSQSMAGNSGYEGHPEITRFPSGLLIGNDRHYQRRWMLRIVINDIGSRFERLLVVDVFARFQISVAPGV
jgi:hypothetical protein